MDTTTITMLVLTATVAVLVTKVMSLSKRQRQLNKLIEENAVEKAFDAIRQGDASATRYGKHLHIAH
jgi:hypothetical protein